MGRQKTQMQPARILVAVLVSVALQAASVLGVSAGPFHTEATEEKLFGWKGESYKPAWKFKPETIRVISWKPRAFIYENFITEEEAQHIADIASTSMKRSTVVGQNGSSVVDSYRTSYGTFIQR